MCAVGTSQHGAVRAVPLRQVRLLSSHGLCQFYPGEERKAESVEERTVYLQCRYSIPLESPLHQTSEYSFIVVLCLCRPGGEVDIDSKSSLGCCINLRSRMIFGSIVQVLNFSFFVSVEGASGVSHVMEVHLGQESNQHTAQVFEKQFGHDLMREASHCYAISNIKFIAVSSQDFVWWMQTTQHLYIGI